MTPMIFNSARTVVDKEPGVNKGKEASDVIMFGFSKRSQRWSKGSSYRAATIW